MTISQQIVVALQMIQTEIRWKPGSLDRHLQSRKRRSHLPADATIADYEAIIRQIVAQPLNQVYIFRITTESYVTVVESSADRPWLVMFDLTGLMETAFIVENPSSYLNKAEFLRLGTIAELLKL